MAQLGAWICIHWVQHHCRGVALLLDPSEERQWKDYGGEDEAALGIVQAGLKGTEERDGEDGDGDCCTTSDLIE